MRLMRLDVLDLRAFYESPLGHVTRDLLRARVQRIWTELQGDTLLALGYATPLLRPLLDSTKRIIALSQGSQGVAYWPREGANCAGLADFRHLPLPDESVDRVILLHALEGAEDPSALLAEVWRVMKAEGRALLFVSQRGHAWARNDATPFGTGQPFSAAQLRSLVHEQNFHMDRCGRALVFPPVHSRWGLALAGRAESLCVRMGVRAGGLLVVELRKQLYAPLMTKSWLTQAKGLRPIVFPTKALPAGRL